MGIYMGDRQSDKTRQNFKDNFSISFSYMICLSNQNCINKSMICLDIYFLGCTTNAPLFVEIVYTSKFISSEH